MARRHLLVLHKSSLYHLFWHSSVSEPPSPPTSCSPSTLACAALSHVKRKNVHEESEKLDYAIEHCVQHFYHG